MVAHSCAPGAALEVSGRTGLTVTAPAHSLALLCLVLGHACVRAHSFNISLRFLVGQVHPDHNDGVWGEQQAFGDLLPLTAPDDYKNLPTKTLHGLLYALHSNASMIIKTDDDNWLNAPVLLRRLERLRGFRGLYAGALLVRSPVIRKREHPDHPNAEADSWDPQRKEFHPYTSGSFTVLSRDAVERVLHGHAAGEGMTNEDAMIGHILHSQGEPPRVSVVLLVALSLHSATPPSLTVVRVGQTSGPCRFTACGPTCTTSACL